MTFSCARTDHFEVFARSINKPLLTTEKILLRCTAQDARNIVFTLPLYNNGHSVLPAPQK